MKRWSVLIIVWVSFFVMGCSPRIVAPVEPFCPKPLAPVWIEGAENLPDNCAEAVVYTKELEKTVQCYEATFKKKGDKK